MWRCQLGRNVIWWISCSAITLVSWSWKAKIVFLGPGMCLQWKTTGPILAWHYSQPSWYGPEALAIWWMGWNGLVVIYFIWICLSEFKLIWIIVYTLWFGSIWCRISGLNSLKMIFVFILMLQFNHFTGIKLAELINLQPLFLFWFKLCLIYQLPRENYTIY